MPGIWRSFSIRESDRWVESQADIDCAILMIDGVSVSASRIVGLREVEYGLHIALLEVSVSASRIVGLRDNRFFTVTLTQWQFQYPRVGSLG